MTKITDVMRRMDYNEEVTNASVRQAQWKADKMHKDTKKEIDSANSILVCYTDTVKKIDDVANEKLQEILEHEAKIKRESVGPKFMNRRKIQPKKR